MPTQDQILTLRRSPPTARIPDELLNRLQFCAFVIRTSLVKRGFDVPGQNSLVPGETRLNFDCRLFPKARPEHYGASTRALLFPFFSPHQSRQFVATNDGDLGITHGYQLGQACARRLHIDQFKIVLSETPSGAGKIRGSDDARDVSVAIVKLDELRVPGKISSRSKHLDRLELLRQRGEQVCQDTPVRRLGKSA